MSQGIDKLINFQGHLRLPIRQTEMALARDWVGKSGVENPVGGGAAIF